jgi:hypothetical protein
MSPFSSAIRIHRDNEAATGTPTDAPTVSSQGNRPVVLHSSKLDEIAVKLNRRPRETLGLKTPAETLEKALIEAADALTA